ncbi:MAG: CHAD domain-containing protein, partial [Bacteroidales bacterium]|nr:CHAD domain-containing protein [Bacteroidales bacterium]
MLLNYVKIKDIKPALSEYIRDSVRLTGPDSLPDDKTVHDIRVLMKKSRAAIKLASTLLDQETFTREYSAFREVGSILSQWRETSVQRKLLKDIRKKHPELMSQIGSDERIAVLMKKPETSSSSSPEVKEKFTAANEILKKSWYRIRFINPGIPDPEKMLKELDKSYGLAKECYIIARNSP